MELARIEGARLTLVNVTGGHTDETLDGGAVADAVVVAGKAGRRENRRADRRGKGGGDIGPFQ